MRALKTTMQRTKYNRNIFMLGKLSYGGLFISIKLFIPENPHLTGFLKALKRSNKTVNTGDSVYTSWWKTTSALVIYTLCNM